MQLQPANAASDHFQQQGSQVQGPAVACIDLQEVLRLPGEVVVLLLLKCMQLAGASMLQPCSTIQPRR
jgi:hypothetical protein